MSDFFKESDCDSTGYYSANEVERISGIRTAGPTISLDKANRLFKGRGTVVYGNLETGQNIFMFCDPKAGLSDNKCTHRALLINIEPLEKDSAEKIVKDLASLGPVDFKSKDFIELFDRARKLRGER